MTQVSCSTAGRSNCEWSSCEEGCTKTIYTCWQIEVAYQIQHKDGSTPDISDAKSVATKSTGRGRLFPNVKVRDPDISL